MSAKPTVVVNGDIYKVHTRDDDTAELAPWRVADDLIKEGKLGEAAEHITKNVDVNAKPPSDTLVYRVFLTLRKHLQGWLADAHKDMMESPASKKPTPYGLYEGHDLRLAGMDTIWSVGRTPEEAISALCVARGWGVIEGKLSPLPAGDTRYTWGYHFCSENGTSLKAAGINVPGGCVLTWWK